MFCVVDLGTIDPVNEIKEENYVQGIVPVFNNVSLLCAHSILTVISYRGHCVIIIFIYFIII